MKITYKKHELQFKFEAATSRGVLKNHSVYYVKIQNIDTHYVTGIGECAPLQGLSIDYVADFEEKLSAVCKQLSQIENLSLSDVYNTIPEDLPSIRFGFETAFLDYTNRGGMKVFSNDFSEKSKPILINGLIWMGSKDLMLKRIQEKLADGYKTLKLKIGAINFEEECNLLQHIRLNFSDRDVTIRLDANGAFAPNEAVEKLERLSTYHIHSIEQPIAAGQTTLFRDIIEKSPIPIALDEELIGVFNQEKEHLLALLKPAYIILKPTILGGFGATKKWIQLAEKHDIKWWITSALESNIGLNAIAQFTAAFNNPLPQGLGTGQLYSNNIESPLKIEKGKLFYDQNLSWDLAFTT